MLGSPHQAEAVSLAALFAVRICFSLTADSTLKKTRPTGYVFQCKHSKMRKAKEKEMTFSRKLQLVVMCRHDMSVRHLKVLFKVNLSFTLLLRALCSAAEFCYFSGWQIFSIKIRMGSNGAPKYGS